MEPVLLLEDELDELLLEPDETVPPTSVLIDITVPLAGDFSVVPSSARCADLTWIWAAVTAAFAWASWLAVGGVFATACWASWLW